MTTTEVPVSQPDQAASESSPPQPSIPWMKILGVITSFLLITAIAIAISVLAGGKDQQVVVVSPALSATQPESQTPSAPSESDTPALAIGTDQPSDGICSTPAPDSSVSDGRAIIQGWLQAWVRGCLPGTSPYPAAGEVQLQCWGLAPGEASTYLADYTVAGDSTDSGGYSVQVELSAESGTWQAASQPSFSDLGNAGFTLDGNCQP